MAFNPFEYTLNVWNGRDYDEFFKVDRHYVKDGALHIFHSNSKLRGLTPNVIIPLHAFVMATVQED